VPGQPASQLIIKGMFFVDDQGRLLRQGQEVTDTGEGAYPDKRFICFASSSSGYYHIKKEEQTKKEGYIAGLGLRCVEVHVAHGSSDSSRLLFVYSSVAPLCWPFEVSEDDEDVRPLKAKGFGCTNNLVEYAFPLPLILTNVEVASAADCSTDNIIEFHVQAHNTNHKSTLKAVFYADKKELVALSAEKKDVDPEPNDADRSLSGCRADFRTFVDAFSGAFQTRVWNDRYVAAMYSPHLSPFVDVFATHDDLGSEEKDGTDKACYGHARFLFRVPLSDYRTSEHVFEFFEHRDRVWLFVNNMHSNFTFYACPSGEAVKTVCPFDFFVSKYFRARDWLALYGWMWGPMDEMYVFDLPHLLEDKDEAKAEAKKNNPFAGVLQSDVYEENGYVGWRNAESSCVMNEEDTCEEGTYDERICRVGVDLDADSRALAILREHDEHVERQEQGQDDYVATVVNNKALLSRLGADRTRRIIDVEPWNFRRLLDLQNEVLERLDVIKTDAAWKRNDNALKRLLLHRHGHEFERELERSAGTTVDEQDENKRKDRTNACRILLEILSLPDGDKETSPMLSVRCFGAESGNDYSQRVLGLLEDVRAIPRGVVRDEFIAHDTRHLDQGIVSTDPVDPADRIDPLDRTVHDALVYSLVRNMLDMNEWCPKMDIPVQNNMVNYRIVLTLVPRNWIVVASDGEKRGREEAVNTTPTLRDRCAGLDSLELFVKARIGEGGKHGVQSWVRPVVMGKE